MSINQKISKDVSNKLEKIFFKCRKLLSFFSLKLFLKNPDVYFSNRIETDLKLCLSESHQPCWVPVLYHQVGAYLQKRKRMCAETLSARQHDMTQFKA